jgi:hypothetical protein
MGQTALAQLSTDWGAGSTGGYENFRFYFSQNPNFRGSSLGFEEVGGDNYAGFAYGGGFTFGLLEFKETERVMTENPQIGATGPQAQQVQVSLREDKATQIYSNVSRVAMGPQAEEVILDLGVMQHDSGKPDQLTMDITARVYMSVFAAKKLALTLSQAVQRYEQQFGPVELDIRRRFKQPG